MEMNTDELYTLLEKAIDEDNHEELMEFLCTSGDEELLNFVINEIGDNIKEILLTSPDSQFKITNILNIILGLAEIALFGPEKSQYLTRSLLNIAVDKCCSIYNLKHVLTMLKTFFSDEHILEWGSSDESLFVPIKQLGVKLTNIGDYECQSILLETLWQISEADRKFWAHMWFSQEKTSLMFLNLNPDKFVLECRKFMNYINRNETNQRTFAFVATSVSLGSVQLKKPYGSEFWVDFNHDTQSISFFCSSLNFENEKTWETVFISSEIVEGYCIQNQKSKTTKELLVTLNCSCSQLLSLEDISIAGLESQLIQMTFWSFLDIQYHAEAIFKRNVPYPVEINLEPKHLKQKRRASEPKDLVCSSDYQEQMATFQNHKQRRASEPIEVLCASNPESSVVYLQRKKHQRASESTELVCASDPQEMKNELHIRKRRRVSESSQLVPMVDTQGDTACEMYADEDNRPNHTEHLPCQGSTKTQKQTSSNLIDLLEDDQNLYSGNNIDPNDYETQDEVGQLLQSPSGIQKKSSQQHLSQSKPKSSQNTELLGVSSMSKRKSSQVSIERNLNSTKKRSQSTELLAVSSMSPRKSSQMNTNINVQSTSKRSENAQLLEVCCNSPRKSSQVSVERHLQSTPKRSQNADFNSNQRNSPQSVSDLEGTCVISPTPLNKKTKTIPKILTTQTPKPTNLLLEDTEYVAESRTLKKIARMSGRLSLGRNPIESNLTTNVLLKGSNKKKRLYNIHRAPVYDVPPSTKKFMNDTNENISHSSQNILSPKETNVVNEVANKENELCNSENEMPQISHSNAAVSKANRDSDLISENETEMRPLSPILAVTENYVQQNVSPRHVLNKNLLAEELSDFEIEAETADYQSHINFCREPGTNIKAKRHEIARNKKDKQDISRQENSAELFDGKEQISSKHSPERKSRKAAVNARKRNKLILEQKGSETSFEGTQQVHQQNKVDGLSQETEEYDVQALLSPKEKILTSYKRKTLERDKNEDLLENNALKSLKKRKATKKTDKNLENLDEDEYVFRTPPPLVKRRKRKRSIFFTDTETGSSEVSWLNKFSLFETPKKSYSNRKKINESKQKKKVKQKPRGSKKPIITPPNIVQRSKASDSESRSKSGLSEIEQFNLVIEKEKNPLPSAELSGLFRNFQRNSRHSSTIEDNFQSDCQVVGLDDCDVNENSVQLCNNDNVLCVSENSASNGGFQISHNAKQQIFQPSTSGDKVNATNEHGILSTNRRNMKYSKVSLKNKSIKEVNISKKRLANSNVSKHTVKKSRNVEHSINNDFNPITPVDHQSKKPKSSLLCQESEKNVFNSVSNTVSNDPQNVRIALETVINVSPFKRNEAVAKRWISPNKILLNSEEQPNLESTNTLTEKSLNKIGDETQGKKLHLELFFESLSSLSPNPQTTEEIEIAEDFSTLENSKSKPIIEKPSKEGLLQSPISCEEIVKGRLKKQKQHAFEKHQTDLTKERNVVSSSFKSKYGHENEEKHSEQDILNLEPSERSFQASSSVFQKAPSREKMSCDNNLPTKTSVLHILSDEVNNLTFRLFCTLKKCMSDFCKKMTALRESIVKTADSMLANESKFTEKDLQSVARNCKESRLHIQKHLRKLYAMGNEYFESEKRLENRLSKKHKKAVIKYTKSLQIAENIAEKALEERFLLKSKAFLKSFLKKMELV